MSRKKKDTGRVKLVWVVESDCVHDSEPFFVHENDGNLWDYKRVQEHAAPTLEELADFCDLKAESRNNHDFVGAHRCLAFVLISNVGRKMATKIMLELAERGGLDGMNGVGSHFEPHMFDSVRIPEPWKPWKLKG